MGGLFISGTDTDVGKTVVSCAIARGLTAAGVKLGVLKPAETGVPEEGPLDARALAAAAGSDDPIELICPQQFAIPAAPLASAIAENRSVDLAAIDSAYQELSNRHEHVLVEGAGGLLVPLSADLDMIELPARLGIPVLLVARASLGTINHTLLSVEACEHRGIDLVGVVISHATGPLTDADAKNLELLRARLGDRLIGEIPPLAEGADADAADLDLARIRQRLEAQTAR